MKIIQELSISEFEPWAGAKSTQRAIIEANKEAEFELLMEDLYPEGLTDTELNDILWHDWQWVFESLEIEEEEEE